MGIGSNITATIRQKASQRVLNSIGEVVPQWEDLMTLHGWIDLSTGDSKYTYDTKLQESTHVFLCDYVPIERKAENKRLVVNGVEYDVLLIDDPMELHQHLEIYLKQIGEVS